MNNITTPSINRLIFGVILSSLITGVTHISSMDDFRGALTPNAAGIFLYTQINDKVHVLLGRRTDDNTWCTMGGLKESTDKSAAYTATRETHEELAHTLPIDPEIVDGQPFAQHTNGKTTYRMYFLEIFHLDTAYLKQQVSKASGSSKEYSEFAWVPIVSLVKTNTNTFTTLHRPFQKLLDQPQVQEQLQLLAKGTLSISKTDNVTVFLRSRQEVLRQPPYSPFSPSVSDAQLLKTTTMRHIKLLLNYQDASVDKQIRSAWHHTTASGKNNFDISSEKLNVVKNIISEEALRPEDAVFYHGTKAQWLFVYIILTQFRNAFFGTNYTVKTLRGLETAFQACRTLEAFLAAHVAGKLDPQHYVGAAQATCLSTNYSLWGNAGNNWLLETLSFFFDGHSCNSPVDPFVLLGKYLSLLGLEPCILEHFKKLYERHIPEKNGGLLQIFIKPERVSNMAFWSGVKDHIEYEGTSPEEFLHSLHKNTVIYDDPRIKTGEARLFLTPEIMHSDNVEVKHHFSDGNPRTELINDVRQIVAYLLPRLAQANTTNIFCQVPPLQAEYGQLTDISPQRKSNRATQRLGAVETNDYTQFKSIITACEKHPMRLKKTSLSPWSLKDGTLVDQKTGFSGLLNHYANKKLSRLEAIEFVKLGERFIKCLDWFNAKKLATLFIDTPEESRSKLMQLMPLRSDMYDPQATAIIKAILSLGGSTINILGTYHELAQAQLFTNDQITAHLTALGNTGEMAPVVTKALRMLFLDEYSASAASVVSAYRMLELHKCELTDTIAILGLLAHMPADDHVPFAAWAQSRQQKLRIMAPSAAKSFHSIEYSIRPLFGLQRNDILSIANACGQLITIVPNNNPCNGIVREMEPMRPLLRTAVSQCFAPLMKIQKIAEEMRGILEKINRYPFHVIFNTLRASTPLIQHCKNNKAVIEIIEAMAEIKSRSHRMHIANAILKNEPQLCGLNEIGNIIETIKDNQIDEINNYFAIAKVFFRSDITKDPHNIYYDLLYYVKKYTKQMPMAEIKEFVVLAEPLFKQCESYYAMSKIFSELAKIETKCERLEHINHLLRNNKKTTSQFSKSIKKMSTIFYEDSFF